MRRYLSLLPLAALAAGCASSEGRTARYVAGKQDLRGAVTQPLEDFNLIRDKIPATLRRAEEGPYRQPEPFSCTAIQTEVAALDDALGPDMDVKDPSPSPRSDQGAAMAAKSAVAAVRDLTTDWIPLRSWVRMLTGAERHSSTVRKAVNAGLMRRAYLKGVAQSQDCTLTASNVPTQFPSPPQTASSASN